MTGTRKLPLLLLFLAACLGPTVADAQDSAERLERILNPLPEYDPFDQPPPRRSIFPTTSINGRAPR